MTEPPPPDTARPPDRDAASRAASPRAGGGRPAGPAPHLIIPASAREPVVHLLCVRPPLRRHHASAVVVFLFVAMLYGLFYATYLRAESFLADIPAIAEKIRTAPMVRNLTEKAEELNRLAPHT